MTTTPPAIPLNDLGRYGAAVAPRLAERARVVLDSGHFVLGPAVAAFEAAFADYIGVAHAVGVANGTDALELALRGAGVVPGDRVVVCANAAGYGTGAVLAIGATPVFADVDDLGLLAAPAVEAVLDALDQTPRALIVTHLYGRLADMPALLAACHVRGITVVEDCAQAHGARRDGRMAGAWGDVAAFSFYPTKNLGAVGDGGAVVSADAGIAARVRQLRQYGWSAKYRNDMAGGRNSRLDELQAAFLLELLPDLDARNARRRAIARRYCDEIRHPEIVLPPLSGEDYVAHLFVVQSDARTALAAHLHRHGVAGDVHYPYPDHRQPAFAAGLAPLPLPVTERHCERVLTLPCFPELREDECDRVVAACNAWEPA